LLYYSTQLGRQSNCLLTIEVARYAAERLSRRLVLPSCHTSPLGEQACSSRPDLAAQRQRVLPYAIDRVLDLDDLARCRRKHPRKAQSVLLSANIPLVEVPQNVTCLVVVSRHSEKARRGRSDGRECESEVANDDELGVHVPFRFTRTVAISVQDLAMDSTPSPLPPGDVYLVGAFDLFKGSVFGPAFELCELPEVTEGVVSLAGQLERSLGFSQADTLCVHWRAEDFHHPSKLVGRHSKDANAAHVALNAILPHARSVGARSILVLTNARREALVELLHSLRDGAAGLRAESPRTLSGTAFECRLRYVYAVYAEMRLCSRARHFLGTPRSSFSQHIVAMRAKRAPSGSATNHNRSSSLVSWIK